MVDGSAWTNKRPNRGVPDAGLRTVESDRTHRARYSLAEGQFPNVSADLNVPGWMTAKQLRRVVGDLSESAGIGRPSDTDAGARPILAVQGHTSRVVYLYEVRGKGVQVHRLADSGRGYEYLPNYPRKPIAGHRAPALPITPGDRIMAGWEYPLSADEQDQAADLPESVGPLYEWYGALRSATEERRSGLLGAVQRLTGGTALRGAA